MGIEVQSLLILATLGGLLIIRVPFAFALGLTAFLFAYVNFGEAALLVVASRMYSFLNEFVLLAIPMFVLMASIMERSGMARELFDAMHVLAGRLRGGIAIQTVGVSVVIAATTGIIGGEIVMLGLVALPQMLRLNYDRRLAIGTICAGGSLGTMIPPSIVLIFYGLTANVSIGDLFAASLVPGLLLAVLYVGYIVVLCSLKPEYAPALSEEQPVPLGSKLRALTGLVFPLLVAFGVLGSIYFGVASISEAAGIGVLTVLCGTALRGELSVGVVQDALKRTMMTCGMLIWLTLGASALIGVYNLMGGIRFVSTILLGLEVEPYVMILFMLLIFFVLGLVIDWIGILLLTMPVFVPVATQLGFDPIWFGVLFCMSMQISYLTPPFGWAAFYLKGVAPPEITLNEIFRSLLPFVGLQCIGLALVFLFPEIALWLPSLATGR